MWGIPEQGFPDWEATGSIIVLLLARNNNVIKIKYYAFSSLYLLDMQYVIHNGNIIILFDNFVG